MPEGGFGSFDEPGRSRLQQSSCPSEAATLFRSAKLKQWSCGDAKKRPFFFRFKANVFEAPTRHWVAAKGLEALGRVRGVGEKPYWCDRVLAGSSLSVSHRCVFGGWSQLWESNVSAPASLQGPPLFSACPPSGSRGVAVPSSPSSPQCSVILNAFFFFFKSYELRFSIQLSPEREPCIPIFWFEKDSHSQELRPNSCSWSSIFLLFFLFLFFFL